MNGYPKLSIDVPHICPVSQNFLHTTHHKVELFKKYRFIDLTAINTYKKRERKNRFSYKLTEITVVKKHGWEKK